MVAMERELKAEFIALMEPLMDLTLLLNPLPHYKHTLDIMDGHMSMRYFWLNNSAFAACVAHIK